MGKVDFEKKIFQSHIWDRGPVLSSSRNMHISVVWFTVGQGDPVYQIEFALQLGWQMKQILLGDLYSHDASLTMLLLFHLTTASFDLSSVA